jgi:glycosyltransferase involved in cell wall biosynthesis
MQTRLSVVLPTFNRAVCLRSAITALLRQTADPASYEVIVVDNNSTDATRAAVASLRDPRLRLVPEERQGLSFARNTGIGEACADLVAFTDDDVEVAPDWVTTVVEAFKAYPEIDGIGGRVLPAWASPPPVWLTRDHWAPLALQDHGAENRTFDRIAPLGLVGANVAFRRGVFDRIGLFSPDVQRVQDGVGSTEDHELLTRLYASGGRMLYIPRLVAVARVQSERYARAYHRRWHTGHGRFHARMRLPEMERSRASIADVPAHLFRTAARDFARCARGILRADWYAAFTAELRLRFFWGFLTARLGSRAANISPIRRLMAPATTGRGIVSVVIPCHNQAHFLPEAIRSIEAGTRTVEIIVVDDGSTDETAAIASRFAHVRCVRQANQGVAAARNRGLREARGEFVVFLDADDRLLPQAIECGAAALEADPRCAMVFGRCVMMGKDAEYLPTPAQPQIEHDHHLAFLRTNLVWTPAVAMFRRAALSQLGGFAAGFDAAADYDLYLRASAAWPVHDHTQLVAAYRQHDSNMSGSAVRMLRDTHAVMRRNRPEGDERLLSAWRDGCRLWREFYGTHLVEEIRAHRRSGETGLMLRKMLMLAGRHPAMTAREGLKKVRVLIGRPFVARRLSSRPGDAGS